MNAGVSYIILRARQPHHRAEPNQAKPSQAKPIMEGEMEWEGGGGRGGGVKMGNIMW